MQLKNQPMVTRQFLLPGSIKILSENCYSATDILNLICFSGLCFQVSDLKRHRFKVLIQDQTMARAKRMDNNDCLDESF